MNNDLKKIKKFYGENMAHLCRELFPTLLEEEGLLIRLIESKFAHSKFLYSDIINQDLVEEFQTYIYSLKEKKKVKLIDTGKTVEELLDEAGYNFYECKTEKEIQKFSNLYQANEKLCTFNGNRLKTCHVFFAVKKNVSNINRKNYLTPKRQDEYGTSVISIQFTRGEYNTLSIKNRYNHTVKNPDATFGNNLENIIPGLTKAFENQYGFKINQAIENFKLDDYVIAEDGKYYKYHEEFDNIYYGPNNIIIDNFKVQKKFLNKSRYIVISTIILDLQESKIYSYNKKNIDSFPEYIGSIKKIIVENIENNNRKITIISNKEEKTILIISPENLMLGYINNQIKEINDSKFLFTAYDLEYFEARNLEKIGNSFLNGGMSLKQCITPSLREVGDAFLAFNENKLEILECPNLEKVGCNFLEKHEKFKIDLSDKRVSTAAKVRHAKVLVKNKIYMIIHLFDR